MEYELENEDGDQNDDFMTGNSEEVREANVEQNSPDVVCSSQSKEVDDEVEDKVSSVSNDLGTKVSLGSDFLDEFLEGGLERGILTTVYGPSGSGKTNLCLMAAVAVALSGKKVLIIDTEGGIAVERIKQLSGEEKYKKVLENILFFQPFTFADQVMAFDKLRLMDFSGKEDLGLIIVDSIAMLYRLELGKAEAIFETNSALARQIAIVIEIARKEKIPAIITNQVYSDFKNKDEVKMVGGDLLKYGSKCLLELKKNDGKHILKLHKHRYVSPKKSDEFVVVKSGFEKSSGMLENDELLE